MSCAQHEAELAMAIIRIKELEGELKTAKALGAYEAGRDHAPAIAELVSTNTRLQNAAKEAETAFRARADDREIRADAAKRDPELSQESFAFACAAITWHAAADLIRSYFNLPAVPGTADNPAIRRPETGTETGKNEPVSPLPANRQEPERREYSIGLDPSQLGGIRIEPAGGPEQDRGAAAIRPAELTGGTTAVHDDLPLGHAFKAAPFYPDRCDVQFDEHGRLRTCARPQREHQRGGP